MKFHRIILCIVLTVAAMATITGCSNKKETSSSASIQNYVDDSQTDENELLRDSLNTARDYMNTLSMMVNEVSDGLNEIKAMEQIVTAANLSGETGERKAQLRNDILLIKNSIQDRQNRLAELEAEITRADAASKFNEDNKRSMMETIANLKQQLAQQQATIDELTRKLNDANTKIKSLNTTVDSLNTVNTAVTNEKIKAQEETRKTKEEVTNLSNELNVCYYAVGTKNELKNHKIIETGFLKKTKVMQSSNIMQSYFTKADKRTLNEINLHSKKAKVMTNHDSQSYSIEDGPDGMKVLKIHNQEQFWQYSNYLVVQVN